MQVPRSKRAQRLKESRGLRAKAPVAAHFEDCVQAFQRLSDSLQVNQSNSELHNISKDCALRLQLWGEGSDASSRALDYALKGSPEVKRQTLRLLEDLHSTLEEGELKPSKSIYVQESLSLNLFSFYRGSATRLGRRCRRRRG
jgi:hypothetical protein